MSKYEHKPGTGSLFRNDKKQDKQPDYTGVYVTDGGVTLRLAAWVKDGKSGKFLSLKTSPMEAPKKSAPPVQDQPRGFEPNTTSDELPF